MSYIIVNFHGDAIVKKKELSFYDRIKDAKKILYLDLGFLGDTIHQIPALNCIRKACPQAEIHAMVGEHIMSIMDVAPWLDWVLGYPRFPKGPVWYKDISRVLALRRNCYDVIINLNGSDRSSLLTRAIGSPIRLGRIPPKIPSFWKYCFTDTVDVPRGTMPVYRQSWQCLKEVGFPGEKPEFNITIPRDVQEKVDELLDYETGFVHISPFTTQDARELPLDILIDFINRVSFFYHDLKIAISCAPTERELSRLETILRSLHTAPWKVFPGNALNPVELAAALSRSRMHIGGDSGAMHIAFMAGTPTLSWCRQERRHRLEWLPDGPHHHALIGELSPTGLQKISSDDLMDLFHKVYIMYG